MSLETYLRAAPKAELHLHLEGAVRPATTIDLAAKNAISLPPDVEHGLRHGFRFHDFEQFIQTYVAVTRCLRTSDDYERVVVELAQDLARQNVRYAEVTCSPSTNVLFLGVPERDFTDGLTRGRRRALQEFGVHLNWIFDIVARSVDPPRNYDFTTSLAVEHRHNGVAALGLVGLLTDRPAEAFIPYVARARTAGLGFSPHAGELRAPEQVWAALDLLGADRIGHGVQSIEDPALVRILVERRIPLEVCPTSNLRLGVVPAYAAHPLRRLHDAGVPITINSDDPALFSTTLCDELALLATEFAFDQAQADGVLLNAVRHAFLPETQKQDLLHDFERELARLKPLHR